MPKKLTAEQFIQKARSKHGNKYDYSKTVYINGQQKTTIICKKHGDFEQRPADHIRGQGCPKCGKKDFLTTEEFIEKSNLIHNHKYDYSKTVYKSTRKKVIIICPVHGEFMKTPNSHTKSGSPQGCPMCSLESRTLTKQQFIKKAKAKHGNKYDYSKTEYANHRTKVTITCPIHGDFTQRAGHHLDGRGCKLCANAKIAIIHGMSEEDWLQRARSMHNNKYDYSKAVYNGAKHKVTIVCPIHGDFKKRASSHLEGQGCPKCAIANLSLTQEQFLQKAKETHGKKYDYSKVVYVRSQDKIKIICPIHGIFEQTANHHMGGIGCPTCGKNLISEPLFREVLEKIFVDKFSKEYKFPNTRPEWLRNPETGYPLELDCYNKELELAFELHGTQHYKPIEYFGGEKAYIKQYRRDLRTRNICCQKGVTLFAIDNRPVYGKGPSAKQQYYEQEILKCLAKVPEKIKVKLLENKVPVQRQLETTIYNV
jgi:hypothetical protein